MARTRKIESYSVVIVAPATTTEIKSDLGAEEVKGALANLEPQQTAYVFAGPLVQWGNEIVLYSTTAPTQQPVERKKRAYNRKPKVAEPAKGANGAGEKKEEQRA